MAGVRVGSWAAILFTVNNVFWFYGEVAEAYIGEALGSIIIVYLCYLVWQGEKRYIYLASLALGLAGGFRQNLILFFFPLWLVSLALPPRSLKRFIASFIILILGCLSWLLPLFWLTGGYREYLSLTQLQSRLILGSSSIFFGAGLSSLIYNMASLLKFSSIYLINLAILLLWFIIKVIVNRGADLKFGQNSFFFILWFAPPLTFYLLFHLAKAGYTLTYLSGAYIILGMLLIAPARDNLFALITKALFVLLIISNSLFFVYTSPSSQRGAKTMILSGNKPSDWREVTRVFTARAIKESDIFVKNFLGKIKDYAPDSDRTLIVTDPEDDFPSWRHQMYYLPDYYVYYLDPKRKDFYVIGREHDLSWVSLEIVFVDDKIDKLIGSSADIISESAMIEQIGDNPDIFLIDVADKEFIYKGRKFVKVKLDI